MAKFFCIGLFLIVSFNSRIEAQGEYTNRRTTEVMPESLRSSNGVSLGFDKLFNTYHWTGKAMYERSFGPLALQFNEQFLSTLIRTGQDIIRDEQSLHLAMKHRWAERLHGAAQVSSYSLSDNQSVKIGSAASHGFYGGVEYTPFDHITLQPMLGARFDNQLGQQDKGLSYLFTIAADSLYYGGYRTRLAGKWEYDKLAPRTLEIRNNAITIEKYFLGQTRNILQVFYNRNRRDFYTNADSSLRRQYNIVYNIETRNEDAFIISDMLDYNIDATTFLTFQGDIYSREISKGLQYQNMLNPRRSTLGTVINELNIDGSMEGSYIPSSNFRSSFRFFYQERDEQHSVQSDQSIVQSVIDSVSQAESRKDNHARRTSLALSLSVVPSSSDSFALSGSGTLLRYDTPSGQNDDDRDELWYILSFSEAHRFNRYLNMRVLAEANLSHLVYLFATRSADNTWNRIFRLSPRMEYVSGSGFSSVNEFEVLANYTVYDFENLVSPIRSFAFRQFVFTDSTTAELTRRLALHWYNQIRLYERGELRWQDFVERPLNYFEDKTYLGMVTYRLDEHLVFSVGIRYFKQQRFAYTGSERQPENTLRSVGPVTSIEWHVGARTFLSVKGWNEHQSITGQRDQDIATMTMMFHVQI